MKKNLFALLAALCVLAAMMAACGGETTSETASVAQEQSAVESREESVSLPEDESDENSMGASTPATPVDTDLTDKLTPAGATVVANEDGQLVMTSTDSVADLKAFYLDVLQELGAEETLSQELIGWTYEGTYDGGTPIQIAVMDNPVDNGATRTITVVYK